MISSALERALFDRLHPHSAPSAPSSATSVGSLAGSLAGSSTDLEDAWRFVGDTLRWVTLTAEHRSLAEQTAQALACAIEEARLTSAEAEQHESETEILTACRQAMLAVEAGASTALPLEFIGHAARFHPDSDSTWRAWKDMVANRVHQSAAGTPFELRAIAERVLDDWAGRARERHARQARRTLRAHVARTVELLNEVLPPLAKVQKRLHAILAAEAVGWNLDQRNWEAIDWPPLELALHDAQRFADLADQAGRIAGLGAGPLVLCIDSSSSMRGQPAAISRALVLHLIRASLDLPRSLIVVGTRRDQSDTVVHVEPGQIVGAASVLALSRLWRQEPAGTGISATVGRTVSLLEQQPSADLDVMVVGDFRFPRLKPDHMSAIRQLQRNLGARFHSFAIHAAPVEDPFNIFDYHWHRRPA